MITGPTRSFSIPLDSWTRIEDVLRSIGMHSLDKAEKRFGRPTLQRILQFLQNIGFAQNSLLTGPGLEYFRDKFILNDGEAASLLLSGAIRNYKPTQAISQLLWGRPGLKRVNVYNLLVSEEYLDPSRVGEDDLGSFMMILNQCGVLKFNKKTNEVTISINPRTDLQPIELTRFFAPDTPFSNLRNIWDVFRSCRGFIHWFDKNFSSKGLELLHDEADGNNVNEIKILSGASDTDSLERIRRHFERFREEMRGRGIACEFRIMTERNLLRKIHDRWILTKVECYNVPPVNSIFMGQYAELKKTDNRPPFGEWWDASLDLAGQWNQISAVARAEYDQVPTTVTIAG